MGGNLHACVLEQAVSGVDYVTHFQHAVVDERMNEDHVEESDKYKTNHRDDYRTVHYGTLW